MAAASASAPLRLLMAAPPDAPGAAAAWDDAVGCARDGGDVAVLLVGAGLSWADRPAALAEARGAGVALSLCSRSARDRRVDPLALPSVRWSSVTAWTGDLSPDARVWSAFP
jgi:hypothetical protein